MTVLSLLILILLSSAFALRIVPHYLSPAGAGVDHWFWKVYIETYRKERVFPPVLPRYILDQHQWYPPLFPLLMAKLPKLFFDRWSHLIVVSIDLLRMCLLLFVVYWQSNGNLFALALAGLLYATIPIQISYNIQLNPRVFGALFLDAILMLLLWFYSYHGPLWIWAVVLLLAGLILLTHKMTTQLFWFIAIGWSVIYGDWRLLMLVPGSMVMAMLLSKGFYWKVLIAHWDIVSFWNKNWKWIGADPVRESPIYGDGKYERPEKLHGPGIKGFFRKWFRLFGFNPAAWIACLLVYERLFVQSPLLIYPTYILVWLLLTSIFALSTTFISKLKCLGAGYLYVYNMSLISCLLIALTYQYTRAPELSSAFAIIALASNIGGVLIFYRTFIRSNRWRIDETFEKTLERLDSLPVGVVMCLPQSWHEPVAYKTGHPVLYGAHGYGFKLLEPTFPRLLLPIKEIVKQYKVRYLLTSEGTLPQNFISDLPPASLITEGEYTIYCFKDGSL